MGAHNYGFPLSVKITGFAIPAVFGTIWFGLRWDAAKYEKVPHDIQHKPWLYYSKGNYHKSGAEEHH